MEDYILNLESKQVDEFGGKGILRQLKNTLKKGRGIKKMLISKFKKGSGVSKLYSSPEDMMDYQPKASPYQNTIDSMIERGQDIANEVAKSNANVRESLGSGVKSTLNNKGFNSRKIKIGKGLELEDEPKFVSFGKYLLNKPHLYNDSKLTLRFPSGGAIPTIKPVGVSED